MKKILVALCIGACLCASAQEKGDMAVGVNIGVAPCLESGVSLTNFGIGAKYQYNVSAPVRLEAGVNYWLKDKGYSVLDVDVNAHYLIPLGSKFKIYPIVGLGYSNLKFSMSEGIYNMSVSENKLHINAGVGFEYDITEKFSVDAELKYSYIENFQRLPIMIGVNYKF